MEGISERRNQIQRGEEVALILDYFDIPEYKEFGVIQIFKKMEITGEDT